MENCQNLATRQELGQYIKREEFYALKNSLTPVFGFLGNEGRPSGPFPPIGELWTGIQDIWRTLNDQGRKELLRLEEQRQQSQIDEALKNSRLAVDKANEAIGKANNATDRANEAIGKANNATDRANEAIKRANEAIKSALRVQQNLNATIQEINLQIQRQNEENLRTFERLKRIADNLNLTVVDINRNTREQNKFNLEIGDKITKLESDKEIKRVREEIKRQNAEITKVNKDIAEVNRQIALTKAETKLVEKAIRTQSDLTGVTRKQLDYQNQRTEALIKTQSISAEKISQVEQQQLFNTRAVGGGAAAAARVEQELNVKLEKALSNFRSETRSDIKKVQNASTTLEKELDSRNLGRLSDLDIKTKELALEIEQNYQALREELNLQKEQVSLEDERLKLKIEATENKIEDLKEENREVNQKISVLSNQIAQGLSRIKALEDKPNLTEQEQAELASIKARIGETKTLIESLRESDKTTQTQIEILKNDQKEQERKLALDLQNQQNLNQQKITEVQVQQQQQQTQLQLIDKTVKENDLKQTKLNNQLKIDIIKGIDFVNEEQALKIDNKLTLIGAGLASLTTTLNPNALNTQIRQATCQTLASPGCSMPLSNNIANQVNNNLNGLNAAGIGAANAQLAAQAGKITEVLARLAEMQAFLTDKFGKLWRHLGESRLWQIINFLLNLHNAIMLSRNLGVTLIETANTVLQAIGIKDPEGNTIDVGSVLGNNFNNFMQGLVGAENWVGFKTTWAKANRILSAATQLKDNILGLGNVVQETQEVIGSWVAKIGNGLKEEGLISDSNYDWMDESPQFKNHFTRFNNIMNDLTEATESINQVASQVVETQELLTEIDSNWDTLKAEINTNSANKGTEETTRTNESSVTVAIENNDLIQAVGE